MPKHINTNLFFIPLNDGASKKIIEKNKSYFNFIFCGGNYYSRGNFLQRIFGGGRDQVALIAGLRLQADGLTIAETQDPNIVLDKRTIQTGRTTNIPLVLNVLAKIPAYMDTIGFSFKIVTLKRSDNFSTALDVLNDNKGIIDGFAPGIVGKALGVGKVVKDMFDKIDSANNQEMLDLTVQDFIITANANTTGTNTLQEGYVVIMLQGEKETMDDDDEPEEAFALVSNEFNNIKAVKVEDQVFIPQPVARLIGSNGHAAVAAAQPIATIDKLQYDPQNKVLKADGKLVTNTYIVFKIEKIEERGENTSAAWSQKLTAALNILINEFNKTTARLTEIMPAFTQLFTEGLALLSQDNSFTQTDKERIREEYVKRFNAEKAKFV